MPRNTAICNASAVASYGAVIEDKVVVAAGTLVPPGKKLASGYLYMGSPCKPARELTDAERRFFRYSAQNYVKLKDEYRAMVPES